MLVVPTSKLISRRLFFTAVGVAGFTPLIWWAPLADYGVDHGTLVLALASGAAVGSLSSALISGRFLASFLPEFHLVDVLPLGAGLAATATAANYFSVDNFKQTLTLLTSQWDNAPHFNMFSMLRHHGAVIATLPTASDGSQWAAASYPQGLHALIATLADLLAGPSPGTIEQELLLYSRLLGIVEVLTVMLVVSGLTSLPVVRRKLLLSLPVVVFTSAAWLIGPGSIPAFGAFPNFGLGCALVASTIYLVQLRKDLNPLSLATLYVLSIVGIAHNWILLLALCVPGALLLGYFLIVKASLNVRQLIGGAGIVAVGMVGLGLAVWQLRSLAADTVLTTTGGISAPDWGLAVLLILTSLILAALFFAKRKAASREQGRWNFATFWIMLSPAVGTFGVSVMAVFQIAEAGRLSYYFFKSSLAVELLAITCIAVGLSELLVPALSGMTRRKTFVAGSLATSLAVTQLFGFSVLGWGPAGLPPSAHGVASIAAQDNRLSAPTPKFVDKLERIAGLASRLPYMYVGFDDGIDPQLASQWSLALGGNWTTYMETALPRLRSLHEGPSHVPDAILPILSSMPGVAVVVDPDIVDSLRSYLPGYSARILTY